MSYFPVTGDFLSNDWIPVIGVGLGFFLVQVVLCFAFCYRLRRQEQTIDRLSQERDTPEDGRSGIKLHSRYDEWVRWVEANFRAGSIPLRGNFTRDDALQELDTQLASNGNYLLLQRMGIMAPLLGVVLTVAGFYWLDVSNDDQSLGAILSAVTPLVGGVGTGAVLALVNQVLLHIAGRRAESLRRTARTWFDAAIWSDLRRDKEVCQANAIEILEDFVRSAANDMNRLSDTLDRAAKLSIALDSLHTQFEKILGRQQPVKQNSSSTSQHERLITTLPRSTAPR